MDGSFDEFLVLDGQRVQSAYESIILIVDLSTIASERHDPDERLEGGFTTPKAPEESIKYGNASHRDSKWNPEGSDLQAVEILVFRVQIEAGSVQMIQFHLLMNLPV